MPSYSMRPLSAVTSIAVAGPTHPLAGTRVIVEEAYATHGLKLATKLSIGSA
jgi:hypothetical protein